MYTAKTVEGVWEITETQRFNELTLAEGAKITAPKGKGVTLAVDGVAKAMEAGTYYGDVALVVADVFDMPPSGLMRMSTQKFPFRTAICVIDGKEVTEKCIPEVVGVNYGKGGPAIYGTDDALNGIVVDGKGEYVINGAKIEFDGFGGNDFCGMGAGILTHGTVDLTVNDSEICLTSAERCCAHIGGDSTVHFNNCTIQNLSPATDRHDGTFAWQIGVRGTNRTIQLTDNGVVYYDNCYIKGNGWGVLSVDGGDRVAMTLKDSKLELSGPRSHGYGFYSIGHVFTTIDHSVVDVCGYPIFIMSQDDSMTVIKNGSLICGKEFGALINGDQGGMLQVYDSTIETGLSTFAIKGSHTDIEISNSKLKPGNGVIVQLYDNDEGGGMMSANYPIPVGVEDEYLEGRDLYSASPDDIGIEVSDCSLEGDFFNSTTNLRWYKNCEINPNAGFLPFAEGIDQDQASMGGPGGGDPEFAAMMAEMEKYKEVLNGPHNMEVWFHNTKLVGVVSSAKQEYAPDVTEIRQESREYLNHVIQTPNKTVNNGVIAHFDSSCVWVVNRECWLSRLTLEKAGVIKAPEGKKLTMFVNDVETRILPGEYKGDIHFVVE